MKTSTVLIIAAVVLVGLFLFSSSGSSQSKGGGYSGRSLLVVDRGFYPAGRGFFDARGFSFDRGFGRGFIFARPGRR